MIQIRFWQLILGCLCALTVVKTQRHFMPNFAPRQALTTCRTPIGGFGQCVSLKACSEVLTLYQKLPRGRATEYATELSRLCGSRITFDNYPIVCCTIANTQDVTTSTVQMTTAATPTEPPDISVKSTNEVPCESPTQEKGTCKLLIDCSSLLETLAANRENETLKAFIRASNRNCGSVHQTVCCPYSIVERNTKVGSGRSLIKLPTEADGCGLSHLAISKIVGGTNSEVGTWPWMALLGYNPRDDQPFKCGGSLITTQHVLSAAHCLQPDLSFVRLGEFDLRTDTETTHIDINIVKAIGHVGFVGLQDPRNDIAMLYLESSVQFTELITPICLPVAADLQEKKYVGYHPFVAGWGRTEVSGLASQVLQEVQIEIYENSVCQNVYTARNRRSKAEHFGKTMVCAGSLAGGKDSCRGDSGGPLMIPENFKGKHHIYLLGIVSYGLGCGYKDVPGIYTRVPNYMDWIEERLAET